MNLVGAHNKLSELYNQRFDDLVEIKFTVFFDSDITFDMDKYAEYCKENEIDENDIDEDLIRNDCEELLFNNFSDHLEEGLKDSLIDSTFRYSDFDDSDKYDVKKCSVYLHNGSFDYQETGSNYLCRFRNCSAHVTLSMNAHAIESYKDVIYKCIFETLQEAFDTHDSSYDSIGGEIDTQHEYKLTTSDVEDITFEYTIDEDIRAKHEAEYTDYKKTVDALDNFKKHYSLETVAEEGFYKIAHDPADNADVFLKDAIYRMCGYFEKSNYGIRLNECLAEKNMFLGVKDFENLYKAFYNPEKYSRLADAKELYLLHRTDDTRKQVYQNEALAYLESYFSAKENSDENFCKEVRDFFSNKVHVEEYIENPTKSPVKMNKSELSEYNSYLVNLFELLDYCPNVCENHKYPEDYEGKLKDLFYAKLEESNSYIASCVFDKPNLVTALCANFLSKYCLAIYANSNHANQIGHLDSSHCFISQNKLDKIRDYCAKHEDMTFSDCHSYISNLIELENRNKYSFKEENKQELDSGLSR